MIKQAVIAAILSSMVTSTAQAFEPGRYSLGFRMGSDFGGTQEIEIVNVRAMPGGHDAFDVKLIANGVLKRYARDRQTVQGLYYEGKFTFIIPHANVNDITAYQFVADDHAVDGAYRGTVFLLRKDAGDAKEGPFPFRMEKASAR